MKVYLKKDYMQYTGSFKERGARYTLLKLGEDQRRRGVISASAGNHAQAMAYHGGLVSEQRTFCLAQLRVPLFHIHDALRWMMTAC